MRHCVCQCYPGRYTQDSFMHYKFLTVWIRLRLLWCIIIVLKIFYLWHRHKSRQAERLFCLIVWRYSHRGWEGPVWQQAQTCELSAVVNLSEWTQYLQKHLLRTYYALSPLLFWSKAWRRVTCMCCFRLRFLQIALPVLLRKGWLHWCKTQWSLNLLERLPEWTTWRRESM